MFLYTSDPELMKSEVYPTYIAHLIGTSTFWVPTLWATATILDDAILGFLSLHSYSIITIYLGSEFMLVTILLGVTIGIGFTQ